MSRYVDGRLRSRWRRSAKTLIASVAMATGIAALAVGLAGSASAAPATASVAEGYAYTCAIRTEGTLFCWGINDSGQLGDGSTTSRATPVRVGTATTWATIDAGTNSTCGVQTDGSLWCWGENGYGQLGVTGTSSAPAPHS